MVSAKEKRLEKRKKALKNIIATWKYYSCESVDSYTVKKIVGIQLAHILWRRLLVYSWLIYCEEDCWYTVGASNSSLLSLCSFSLPLLWRLFTVSVSIPEYHGWILADQPRTEFIFSLLSQTIVICPATAAFE